jgi:Rab proteins geranylgeranyltransferase component A
VDDAQGTGEPRSWIVVHHSLTIITGETGASIVPVSLWMNPESNKLGSSRSYTLTLSPHLIYSQSPLLPALVSSRLHTQLDFQAVGSWWIYRDGSEDASTRQQSSQKEETKTREDHDSRSNLATGTLQKIPSNREDVFADNSLSPRDKRSLMKFLRAVISESSDGANPAEDLSHASLPSILTTRFGVPPDLQQPLLALSLSYDSSNNVKTKSAVPRIRRHMRSIGAFGPGFGAVMPKYGGGAEIAQVACRASAVGGAVYVLGRGLRRMRGLETESVEPEGHPEELVHLELSDGENIKARFVAGCAEDVPPELVREAATDSNAELVTMAHSINIVSSPLDHLFPPTSENGPVPAGAVVVIGGEEPNAPIQSQRPTYLVIHSSDSGECPPGQCEFPLLFTECLASNLPSDDLYL